MTDVFPTPAILHSPVTEEATSTDVFNAVSRGLLELGAVAVVQFLNDSALTPSVSRAPTAIPNPAPAPSVPDPDSRTFPRAVATVHQACQHAFGSTDALRFAYDEDSATSTKRCTLTVTRPDGEYRTYTSSSPYTKQYDAKVSACTVAIKDGVLDFIAAGKNAGAPSTAPSIEVPTTPLEMSESMKAIEQCCLEITSGVIKPFWLGINEPKFGRTQGCALRIRLSSRNRKVYSVNTIYNSLSEARNACAEVALAEGVLDYIKAWSPVAYDLKEEPESTTPLSLQQFFDLLPKPFPEPVVGTAADMNGPAWLNTTIQAARGAKLVPNFIWIVDPRFGFHGCLLRLERPGEVRSYLVEAQFTKRMEAKAAVCLLAMSEGVGEYIRKLGEAVVSKLSPETRRYITEVLQPTLTAEYRKVRGPGISPTFEYDVDLDATGATMTVELCANANAQQSRRYVVAAEYCNRPDAKLAVILRAAEEGVIEFLRFKGNPPPPGYIPYWQRSEHQSFNHKRKSGDMSGSFHDVPGHNDFIAPGHAGWAPKRQRIGGGHHQGGQSYAARDTWSIQGFWRPSRPPRASAVQKGGLAGMLYPNQQFAPSPSSTPLYSMSTPPPGYHPSQAPAPPFSQVPGGFIPSSGLPAQGSHPGATPPVTAPYQTPPVPSPVAPYPVPQPIPPAMYPSFVHPPPIVPVQPSLPYSSQPYQYPFNAAPPALVPPYVSGYSHFSVPYGPAWPPTSSAPNSSTSLPPYPSPAVAIPQQPVHVPGTGLPVLTSVPKPKSPPPPPPPPATTAPPLPLDPNQPKTPIASSLTKASPAASTSSDAKPKVAIAPVPQKHVKELSDFCENNGRPKPRWGHEPDGKGKHKVWVIVEKTKYELPMTFSSLADGQERVAKKVFAQLSRPNGGKKAG